MTLQCRKGHTFKWSDSLQWYPGYEGKAIMCPECGIDVSNGLKNHPSFRKKVKALKEKKEC